MEKDRTRALRRYQKEIKFKKRIKTWFPEGRRAEYFENFDEFAKEVKEGKAYTFLRTTGNPCNCFMCSQHNKFRKDRTKFEREALEEALKEIEEELEEELNN